MKKNTFLFIMVIFMICMVFVACNTPLAVPINLPEVSGTIFYCSLLGNDLNDGSEENPWRHPGYGSRQLKPGNMLIIKSGEYVLSTYPDDMIMPTSGEATSPVIIRGEGVGNTVLKGTDNLYAAVVLDNCAYVTIQNLEITNDASSNFRDGINGLDGSLHHIILDNLSIHHLDEFGVNFKDISNSSITNSTIEYCGFGALGGPAGVSGWTNVII
jgi:hypothetical protein